ESGRLWTRGRHLRPHRDYVRTKFMASPLSDDDVARIQAAVFAGRKIEAIKLYRGCSGTGLKEAKDFIETLESELRRTDPEKFSGPPAKGCTITAFEVGFVLFVAMLSTFAFWN